MRQLSLLDPVAGEADAAPPAAPAVPVRWPAPLERRVATVAPALWAELSAQLPALGRITLTDNRSSILSVRSRRNGAGSWLDLRLHWCFAHARDEVLAAVAGFAGATSSAERRRHLERLRAFHRAHGGPTAAASRRRPRLRPRGEHHDLVALRDELAGEHFAGRVRPPITWGRRRPSSRRRDARRSIRLGSYDHDSGVIRIHPLLDQPWVPRVVVASVVYHELLHALLPPTETGGRRCLHGAEFRRLEALFPGHAEAEGWLATNLRKLLRS